jgi:polar amino acid transport system substrate-binding protein
MVMVLSACGGSGDGDSPAAATQGGTGSASPGLTVPAGALLQGGQLSFCSDLSSPPLELLDPSQKPSGAEVELGDALAKTLGLTAEWKNTAFAGIIPALQGKQCDAILSQLFIKPEREKVVDFVPYMYSSGAILVKADADKGIAGLDTTCGHRVAAETGTTASTFLQQASDKCTSGGQTKVDIRLFANDAAALQQLKVGLVDAYGTTVETAGYVMKENPGVFKTVGAPYGQISTGIATRKDNAPLHDALAAALASVQKDGTYDSILKDWNLSGDALKAS